MYVGGTVHCFKQHCPSISSEVTISLTAFTLYVPCSFRQNSYIYQAVDDEVDLSTCHCRSLLVYYL